MIGVCDSGVGGLLLLKNLHHKYPHTDILFYGDTKHMPYGNKTSEEIRNYFSEIAKFFKDRGCSDVVIACNSMCSSVDFNKDYGLNVHDIILKTASNLSVPKDKKIIVFSTIVTKNRGRYIEELNALGYKNVLSVSLDHLAYDIETFKDKELIKKDLYAIFDKLDNENVGAIILGCTHYPVYKDIFFDYYNVDIYDSNNLDFNLLDKKEKGQILIHMPQSEKLNKFIKEYCEVDYIYD